MLELQESFKLSGVDAKMQFSVSDNRLLFLHSPFTSSQLIIDELGVNGIEQGVAFQLQFYLKGGENYFSFFFEKDQEDSLIKYFRKLRFKMEVIPHLKIE